MWFVDDILVIAYIRIQTHVARLVDCNSRSLLFLLAGLCYACCRVLFFHIIIYLLKRFSFVCFRVFDFSFFF